MTMALGKFGTEAVLLYYLLHLAAGMPQNTERLCTGACQKEDKKAYMPTVMKLKLEERKQCVAEHKCPLVLPAMSYTPCAANGTAGVYECSNVDLLYFVPLKEMGSKGSGEANDIWGWTDPETGHEYAIVGCSDGTSFVDITDPKAPQVMAFLPTHTVSSIWRDVKVYEDHAFIVSEASNHGMQVYNLKKLKNLTPGVNIIKSGAHYDQFGKAHNIVVNTETGYIYAVGTRTCRSGLHIIDVKEPLNPKFSGCFSHDGYIHDAQCVVYKGPDTRYQGREICFSFSEFNLTLVDVTEKNKMKIISRVSYDRLYYTHQGWLTENQAILLLNDELDELFGSEPRTRTMFWNVADLEKPTLMGSFFSKKNATDHNLYIKGSLTYETNYCAGLRILDISNIDSGGPSRVKEVGYFDTAPDCDAPGFHGAWSSYVYFNSDTIIVSSMERGLFILKYTGKTQ